jgi:hypothetical protein
VGYNGKGAPLPTLIVVSGPAGSGKTTLAHAIASAVGCPAVCRDEIKEGMVHATWGPAAAGFVARPGDELTVKTLPVFLAVFEVLLKAGVTTVAEAAFQDHGWRPRLEPLLDQPPRRSGSGGPNAITRGPWWPRRPPSTSRASGVAAMSRCAG